MKTQRELKQLCSVTTRPRRYPGEDTHVFVSEEEANKMTERVAETVIAGYQYFATVGQFEECDVYVIDPRGLSCVCTKAPHIPTYAVYVTANDDVRLNRAKSRAADPELAEKVFKERHADEDAQFSEFEQLLTQGEEAFKKVYTTVKHLKVVDNNGADTTNLREAAKEVLQTILANCNPNEPLAVKIMPIGRSGCGKDTFAATLAEVWKEINA